jgi:hypothetical protein
MADEPSDVIYDRDAGGDEWDDRVRSGLDKHSLELALHSHTGTLKAYLIGECPRCHHKIGGPASAMPIRRILTDQSMYEARISCDCGGLHLGNMGNFGCGLTMLVKCDWARLEQLKLKYPVY